MTNWRDDLPRVSCTNATLVCTSANHSCTKCKMLLAHIRQTPPTPLGIFVGHTPSTAGTFRKKFRKNSGKTPETLSERFLEFPSRVRLGCPKPYNSRHLRLPEHFQNSLPPSTAGGASFFRSGSGEGLPDPVMEFPAVLGVFLILINRCFTRFPSRGCKS